MNDDHSLSEIEKLEKKLKEKLKLQSQEGSNSTATFDVDKKLSDLLKYHVTIKHTKNEKRNYTELLEYTIQLELLNADLERKNEMLKMENLKKEQIIADLKIQLNENKIKLSMKENKLQMIENTFSSLKNLNKKYSTSFSSDNDNQIKIYDNSSLIEDGSSFINELSLEKEEKNSFLLQIKKSKNFKSEIEEKLKKQKNVNKSLLKELNTVMMEVQSMKEQMNEKDNIISILYGEIENLKKSEIMIKEKLSRDLYDINKEEQKHSPKLSNFIYLIQNHLDHFDSIRKALNEFIKCYGINEIKDEVIYERISHEESFNEGDDSESVLFKRIINELESEIEVRMKDINYILKNLNKINIIFKSLMVDYSKNILSFVEKNVSNPIMFKMNNMSNRYNKLNSILNKINITLK